MLSKGQSFLLQTYCVIRLGTIPLCGAIKIAASNQMIDLQLIDPKTPSCWHPNRHWGKRVFLAIPIADLAIPGS
jgi:hypothetical protein